MIQRPEPNCGHEGYPATAAFAAWEAFIHSVSQGAWMLEVMRQSATKVPWAPLRGHIHLGARTEPFLPGACHGAEYCLYPSCGGRPLGGRWVR